MIYGGCYDSRTFPSQTPRFVGRYDSGPRPCRFVGYVVLPPTAICTVLLFGTFAYVYIVVLLPLLWTFQFITLLTVGWCGCIYVYRLLICWLFVDYALPHCCSSSLTGVVLPITPHVPTQPFTGYSPPDMPAVPLFLRFVVPDLYVTGRYTDFGDLDHTPRSVVGVVFTAFIARLVVGCGCWSFDSDRTTEGDCWLHTFPFVRTLLVAGYVGWICYVLWPWCSCYPLLPRWLRSPGAIYALVTCSSVATGTPRLLHGCC